jgi:hypothetical protein
MFSQKGRANKALCTRVNTLRPGLFGESSGYETRPHVLAALVVGEKVLIKGEEQRNKTLSFFLCLFYGRSLFFFSFFFYYYFGGGPRHYSEDLVYTLKIGGRSLQAASPSSLRPWESTPGGLQSASSERIFGARGGDR